MIVYHGSTDIVTKPDVSHSYRSLDFGMGFYVTTVWEQAARWARRKMGKAQGRYTGNRQSYYQYLSDEQ